MLKRMDTVSLLAQLSGRKPYYFDRVNELLDSKGLVRFRAAVAYARWDGIGLIAERLESFLHGGGEFQSIYGVANGVTTPDSLLYSLYLQELFPSHTYAGAVEDKYINATFHAKFFEFRFEDRIVVMVGSANLTGAGMSRNTEIGAEIQCELGSTVAKRGEMAWRGMQKASRKLTLPFIRSLRKDGELGFEQDKSETRSDKAGKQRLRISAKAKPKPLFSKVLDLDKPTKKSKILAKFDPLSDRPETLYLQVLEYETGAQAAGGVGYQVQLPVATLATFFGVGVDQARKVTFRFSRETIEIQLTHFANNTHRVRLRPLRDVARPAIVKIRRIGEDAYRCSIVRTDRYEEVLETKCVEQTRKGARRWGLE